MSGTQLQKPIGSVCAINASLNLVLLDRALAGSWRISEPDDDGPAEFTPGHPAEILESIGNDATVHQLDVGGGRAIALSLEGATGMADLYRLGADALIFVEPPIEWWLDADNYGKQRKKVTALFTEVLSGVPAAAGQLGTIDLTSGTLVAFDMWERLETLPAAVAPGSPSGATQFGDDALVAQLVSVPPGRYRVLRHAFSTAWDDQECVAAYLVPER